MKTHFLSDEIYPTLTDDERAECDKEITVTELTHALSLLNKDSAPGSDSPSLTGCLTLLETYSGTYKLYNVHKVIDR